MFNSSYSFKESLSLLSESNPIYIKNITYNVFIELLHYIYTGHINIESLQLYEMLDLIRVSDYMGLSELQSLCLFHFSQLVKKENAIEIFKEIAIQHQLSNIFDKLLNSCYDLIANNFSDLCKTQEFCSLSQELMLHLIQIIIPRLEERKGTET
jgi:hypothetical protein